MRRFPAFLFFGQAVRVGNNVSKFAVVCGSALLVRVKMNAKNSEPTELGCCISDVGTEPEKLVRKACVYCHRISGDTEKVDRWLAGLAHHEACGAIQLLEIT